MEDQGMSIFLRKQHTNCLYHVRSAWIYLSIYLNSISIILNCYSCKRKMFLQDYCFYLQLGILAHNQHITRKCSASQVSVRSRRDHHHNTCHWLSACYVPHTVHASLLALPPLIFTGLIKWDYLLSFSSGGKKVGLAQRCTISEWQNWDLKQSWLTQSQWGCFWLRLTDNTKY